VHPEAGITVDTRPLRFAGGAALLVAATRPSIVRNVGLSCPFRALTGVPCPFCGLTRGVVAAVHGDVVRALLLNPASVVVVLSVVALLLLWRLPRVMLPMWALPAFVAALWAFEVFKYANGLPL
jgi:hypothetical protein